MAEAQAYSYLVYGDNGMQLVYAGDNREACEAVCREQAGSSAGYVSGYQFVGRQRYELRCFLDREPDQPFMALRSRRELFDFAWHPVSG